MVIIKRYGRRERGKRPAPPVLALILMSLLPVLLCCCSPPSDMTEILSYQDGAASVSLEGSLCGVPFTACLTLEETGEGGVRSRNFVLAYTGGALGGITLARTDGVYRAAVTDRGDGEFGNIEFNDGDPGGTGSGGAKGVPGVWQRLCLPAEAFCLDVLSAGVRTRREEGTILTLIDITESDGGCANLTFGGDGMPCYIKYVSADGRVLDAAVIYLPAPERITHGTSGDSSGGLKN